MKKPAPKKVNYELIPPTKQGEKEYKLLEQIRRKVHPELEKARIALAWRKALKANVDGHLLLGKCIKVSDLQKETTPFDFIILLNQEVWNDKEFTAEQKAALLDHELCHAAPSLDQVGEPKFDERGRQLFRIRKHDIEEFSGIVQRHGCYKKDLEAFADALLAKRAAPLLNAIMNKVDQDRPRDTATQ